MTELEVMMGKFLKTVGIAAVAGFAAGALLALALPSLASLVVGAEAVTTTVGALSNPLWLGTVVSGMSGITATVTPLIAHAFNTLFDKKSAPETQSRSMPVASAEQSPSLSEEVINNQYRDMVMESKKSGGIALH